MSKNSNGSQTLESMSQAVWYNQWTVKKFRKYLSGDILEVGCGIGNFTKALKDFGNVWAIDINKDYVQQTRKIIGNVGVGDIEAGKYFFKSKKFDTIICINVLEHIKDDRAALKNINQLLKRGGYLILLVPAFNFLYGEIDKSIGHFRRYERKDLLNLLKELEFEIIENRIINFLGAIGWWISSKILSESKVEEEKIKIFNMIAPLALSLEDVIEPPIGTSILIVAKKKEDLAR